MPIDLANETPVALADVPTLRWLRRSKGRRLSIATVYRWCQRGLRGRRLEYVQLGGTKVTSEEALKRFFSALTKAENSDSRIDVKQSDRDRLVGIEKELASEGI